MTFAIRSTEEESQGAGVKCLIYGRAGVGKTYLARTAPKPLIISSEAGLLSLRDVRLPVISIKTKQELTDILSWLQVSPETRDYWTIYIDSISEIAEVILEDERTKRTDPRQAYGELLIETTKLLRGYRNLPNRHVVMVAKQEKLRSDASTMYGPSMPGAKLGNELPYMFDEVFHLDVGQTEKGETYRYLQTQVDLQFDAKDRSGILDKIERPDLDYIFNKILNEK